MCQSKTSAIAAVHRAGELALEASVITIGAFDSVHRGHQEVIRRAVGTARRLEVPSVVYTFDPLPKIFFGQAEALTSLSERLRRIAALGPDYVVVATFDRAYACRPASDFIEEISHLHPMEIVIGEDFRFGSCKTGNDRLLRQHFPTTAVPPVRCENGLVISSSRIRTLRSLGILWTATRLENWSDGDISVSGVRNLAEVRTAS
jgi:riboflavin kinase / FMN adenylyltransferase